MAINYSTVNRQIMLVNARYTHVENQLDDVKKFAQRNQYDAYEYEKVKSGDFSRFRFINVECEAPDMCVIAIVSKWTGDEPSPSATHTIIMEPGLSVIRANEDGLLLSITDTAKFLENFYMSDDQLGKLTSNAVMYSCRYPMDNPKRDVYLFYKQNDKNACVSLSKCLIDELVYASPRGVDEVHQLHAMDVI